MKNQKYVIICVGHTHAGKTTFAKKWVKKNSDCTMLDSDEVAVFLRRKYLKVVDSDYNKARNAFANPNLKTLVFKDVYRFCLAAGVNIILSNGNLTKNIRAFFMSNAKRRGYKVALVYFNLPREIVMRRLAATKKSGKVFVQSKSWQEVMKRQDAYAQLPPSRRGVAYFEIKVPSDVPRILKGLNEWA